MKNPASIRVFVAIIAAAMLAGTANDANALVEKKNFEAAAKAGKNDGVIVFVYGPNWEHRGEKMLKTLLTHKDIKKSCGGAGLVAIPYYQRATDKERKETESIAKGFKTTKAIRSFPAFIMKGADGNDYYQLYGDEILQEPEKVAALLNEKFELYKKQRDLIKKAEKAKGIAMAKLYAEAACIEGINPPPRAAEIIRNNDPKLQEDICARAVFDVYKLFTDFTHAPDKSEKVERKMYTTDEALARLKELTAGDRYTPQQKQEIYLAATGLLRRSKYDSEKLHKLYTEMALLDPKSVSGQYARNAAKIYTGTPVKLPKKPAESDGNADKKSPKK